MVAIELRWPVRSALRARNSEIAGCGNLGAPPRPPFCLSMSPDRSSAAWSRSVGVGPCRGGGRKSTQMVQQGDAVVLDAIGMLGHRAGDRCEHLDEGGAAVARFLREIGAAPDRFAFGRQEHRQRPPALLSHRLQRRHIDGVDVRPLFAVDLDVDEEPVHDLGRGRVFEAFMGHDMAPMTGRIADGEKDRSVQALRFGKGFAGPMAANRPGCRHAAGDRGWSRCEGDCRAWT